MRSGVSVFLALSIGWACVAHADPLTLRDDSGALVQVPVPGVEATVLVFVTPACPQANRYAPVLRELAEAFAGRARFFRVYASAEVTAAEITEHEKAYQYGFPALRDPAQAAVRHCGATRTPEVAVLDATGGVRYLGAVDDRYTDFGKYRQAATKHYLRDAVDAVLAGKEAAVPRTQALGCFIPAPPKQEPASERKEKP